MNTHVKFTYPEYGNRVEIYTVEESKLIIEEDFRYGVRHVIEHGTIDQNGEFVKNESN